MVGAGNNCNPFRNWIARASQYPTAARSRFPGHRKQRSGRDCVLEELNLRLRSTLDEPAVPWRADKGDPGYAFALFSTLRRVETRSETCHLLRTRAESLSQNAKIDFGGGTRKRVRPSEALRPRRAFIRDIAGQYAVSMPFWITTCRLRLRLNPGSSASESLREWPSRESEGTTLPRQAEAGKELGRRRSSVSYTHLTLPTILLV